MDISGPLNLMPVNRPPPTFTQFALPGSHVRTTPPRFNNAAPRPTIREHKLQTRNLTQPQLSSATEPPSETDTLADPWKMAREFDEILETYQEPEPEPEPEPLSDIHHTPRQPELFQTNLISPKSEVVSMNNPRETVPIGFDASYETQQSAPEQTRPDNALEKYPFVVQAARPAPSPQPVYGQKAQYSEEVRPVTPPQPQEAGEDAEYSPDWIAQEPRDITDKEFYDPDPDHGLYTYENERYGAGAESKEAGVMGVMEVMEDDEFERPRQVPYDHRQTMSVVKEDIDFFMALVVGTDPPAATTETQNVISEEQEHRRRSSDVEAQDAARRRQEELETTDSDLTFWMSLMAKE